LDYLIRKLGYDPSIPEEVQKSVEILAGKGIVTMDEETDTYTMWPQLCLMTENITVEEF